MTQFSDNLEPDNTNYGGPPQASGGGGMAIASLVLGCVGIVGWIIACCGFIICLVGLILGIIDLKGPKRGIAIAGIVLCSIGLLLSILNAIAGAIMAANGNHPLVQ